MGPEESDGQHSGLILQACNQSIVITFDVEYHSAALENARLWIRRLLILRGAPLCAARNGKPRMVLRPCRFDSFVARVGFEVALNDIGIDNKHLKKYSTSFQKLEE